LVAPIITHGSSRGKGRVRGVINVINATIMQMSADQKVIIMMPIMLKKMRNGNGMQQLKWIKKNDIFTF